jgi:hypothetical protein
LKRQSHKCCSKQAAVRGWPLLADIVVKVSNRGAQFFRQKTRQAVIGDQYGLRLNTEVAGEFIAV